MVYGADMSAQKLLAEIVRKTNAKIILTSSWRICWPDGLKNQPDADGQYLVDALAKENKKFQFSRVAKNARSRQYMGCIDWMKDAGVVNICYCLNFPELPLKGNYDDLKFKLYYPDTGLLISTLDEETQEDLRANRNLGVYKGALYENFAAEAFVKQGLGLFYYKKENSTLEEDSFVRDSQHLIPVKVKSGNNRSK